MQKVDLLEDFSSLTIDWGKLPSEERDKFCVFKFVDAKEQFYECTLCGGHVSRRYTFAGSAVVEHLYEMHPDTYYRWLLNAWIIRHEEKYGGMEERGDFLPILEWTLFNTKYCKD